MALVLPFQFLPVGNPSSDRVQADFESIVTGVDFLSTLQQTTNRTIADNEFAIVAPYYKIALGSTLFIGLGAYFYIYEGFTKGRTVHQIQIGTTATAATTTSTTFADTNLSVNITPVSPLNSILIIVVQECGAILTAAANTAEVDLQLLRNGDKVYGPVSVCEFDTLAISSQINFQAAFFKEDSPATTSTLTYKTQFARGGSSNAITHNVQASGATSHILALELGPVL